MRVLQMRRPFKGHRTTNMDIGRFDLVLAKAKMVKQVKIKIIQLRVGQAKLGFAEINTKGELVKDEFHIKGTAKVALNFGKLLITKAFVFQRVDRD